MLVGGGAVGVVGGGGQVAVRVVVVFADQLVGGVEQFPQPAQVVEAAVDAGVGDFGCAAAGDRAFFGAVAEVIQHVLELFSGGVLDGVEPMRIVIGVGGGARGGAGDGVQQGVGVVGQLGAASRRGDGLQLPARGVGQLGDDTVGGGDLGRAAVGVVAVVGGHLP